jgi:hypothetical protein
MDHNHYHHQNLLFFSLFLQPSSQDKTIVKLKSKNHNTQIKLIVIDTRDKIHYHLDVNYIAFLVAQQCIIHTINHGEIVV